MRKTLYSGNYQKNSEKLFDPRIFDKYLMAHWGGLEMVRREIDGTSSIWHIEPPGVTLIYSLSSLGASVEAVGSQRKISEIERKILQAANDFGK